MSRSGRETCPETDHSGRPGLALAESNHLFGFATPTQERLEVSPIVIGVGKDTTKKSGLRLRLRRLVRAGAGIVGLALVTATTATVLAPPGPVAADQVSDLKARAAQIAKDLVLEQLQIGTYQQHDDIDIAKVQRDEAEIRSTENQISVDISRVRRDPRAAPG